jgi:hypothetical protein
MGLKLELEQAPEESIKGFYKEVNGKFVLDVEGAVPVTKLKETEAKLEEFRTNNITLKQQLETVTKTPLKDVPTSQINVEQILEKHVSEMKTAYESQVQTLAQQKAELEGHLERVVLSDSVKDAAIKYGVHESALPDVMNRAKEVFTVQAGKAVPKEKKVDKAGNPYGIESWLQSLNETAPHLFAQSRGSGSQRPVKGPIPQGTVHGVDRIAQGLKNLRK